MRRRKKDKITVTICLIVLALCGVVWAIRWYNASEDKKGKATQEEKDLSSKETVLDTIKKEDKKVEFVEEYNGCWTYKSETKEYVYCEGDEDVTVNVLPTSAPQE